MKKPNPILVIGFIVMLCIFSADLTIRNLRIDLDQEKVMTRILNSQSSELGNLLSKQAGLVRDLRNSLEASREGIENLQREINSLIAINNDLESRLRAVSEALKK